MSNTTSSRFNGRRITVMGLGLFGGGAATARYLARRGADVTVTDLRRADELAPTLRELGDVKLRFVLGEHRFEDFTQADFVVANPAVPPTSPYLQAAREHRVPVTSETALFLEVCPARIAAVTGTQGKSSTCYSLAQLLEASGFRVHLGGNIGHSLLESAEEMKAEDIVVLEISSYQLEALPLVQVDASRRVQVDASRPVQVDALRPVQVDASRPVQVDASRPARVDASGAATLDASRPAGSMPRARVEAVAVTNVLADHLERHGSIDNYAAAKRRILELAAHSNGTAFLPAEDPRIAGWRDPLVRRVDVFATRASDVGLNFDRGCFRSDREVLGEVGALRLPGEFQRENTLVALGMARHLGADPAPLAAAIAGLRALPHRLEDLGLRRGHRVWDNGVSTTPDSTMSVLGSIAIGCTLLVGGKAKVLPLEDLLATARGRVRRVIAFGSASAVFGAAFQSAGIESWTADTVEAAVETAFAKMEPGEELLFSPACASFDAYLNFKERALAFRRALPPLDLEVHVHAARA